MPKEGELCQVFDVRQSQKVAADTNQRFFLLFYFIVVLKIIKRNKRQRNLSFMVAKNTILKKGQSHLIYVFCWRKFSLWREPLYKFKASIFWNVKFPAYWTSWKDVAVSFIELIITKFEWLYCWLKLFCVGNKWQEKCPMIMNVLIFSLKAEK